MFRSGKMWDKKAEMKVKPWVGKMEPFKIFGSTYFVGTYQSSTHIIDTGDGLIMIDPGYSATAYLVINSIYKLGFKPSDVKYIINTHWHWDHVEASAAFADLCGAKTLIGKDDEQKAKKYFDADILINDGDELVLGNKKIRFLHTPGHTAGTVSIFYEDTDGVNTYRVGMFGGAGANTLVPPSYDFEGCRESYFASIERLKQEKVDVFIGNHTWNNGTYEKYLKLSQTGENTFIDSNIWYDFLNACQERLENIIQKPFHDIKL